MLDASATRGRCRRSAFSCATVPLATEVNKGKPTLPLSTKSTFCYLDVVSVNEELLTVRETAKRLGVHENTVRNWSQNGALDATRLPGSRFLRFRPSDVEALIAQRNSRIPTLLSERRAVSPELVTANQLKQWPVARSRDAQERFPELIRRLLIETPGFSNISIRAGDGIALEGFDGVADSLGTKFLPAGKLVFEFGVNERPESKATSDYNNRVSSTPSSATFVFATPRRWAKGLLGPRNERTKETLQTSGLWTPTIWKVGFSPPLPPTIGSLSIWGSGRAMQYRWTSGGSDLARRPNRNCPRIFSYRVGGNK